MGERTQNMRRAQQRRDEDLPRVVVDACVWHAAFLRDLIVHAAVTGAVFPVWTPTIEAEWTRSVIRRRPEITMTRIQLVADRMRAAMPGGCIAPPSVPPIPLQLRARFPDPCDLHVVGAAIAGAAPFICTFDRRGFPAGALRTLGIEAITPDRLLQKLLARDRPQLIEALHRHRASLRSPPADARTYGEMLQRNALAETARAVENELEKRAREG